MKIPKYIFQTWKTKVNIDNKRSKYIKTIKLFNPNAEHFIYDDDDCDQFVKSKFYQYYKYYLQLKTPVQKADLWRYLIIYYYGGYYLDIDCKVVTGLDFTTDSKKDLLIVEVENPAPFKPITGFPRCPQYAQYWFGATPRHPAILNVITKVIQNIKTNKKYKGDNQTLYLTGPVPWTDGISECSECSENKGTKHNGVIFLKPNQADVVSVGIDTQLVHKYKNVPVIHQAAGSWRDKNSSDDNSYFILIIFIVLIGYYLCINSI